MADIVVISDTWLTRSVSDADIYTFRYNGDRTNMPQRGGGVATCVESKFDL